MSHIFIFVSIFNKSIIKKILFRVFNPWRQIEKYDSECIYIKTWLPQLKDVPNKDILKWNEKHQDYKDIDYPKPIIEDIQAEFKKTLKLIK